MALTVGELQILVDVNTREIDKLKAKLEDVTKQSKKTQMSFGKLAAAFGLATGGIELTRAAIQKATQAFKFAVNTARDLEESQNKLNVTFKGLRKEADATRDALVKAYGFSTKEATELLGATGDLLTGLGFQREEALKLSTEVQKLSSDLASFQNLEGGAARASEALTKALLGETEMAKSLGIVIRQGTKEFNAQIKAIMEQTGATEIQAKAQLILQQAVDQSKNAIGDFGRTSEGLANRQRRLLAVQEDLAASIGKNFLPVINFVTGQVLEATEKLKAFFETEKTAKKLQTAIKAVSISFFVIAKAVQFNFLLFKSFGKIVITLGKAFLELIRPLEWVVEAITNFAKAIVEKLKPVIKGIGKAIEFVNGKAQKLAKTFRVDLEKSVDEKKVLNFRGALDKLGEGFGEVAQDNLDFINSTKDGVIELFDLYKEKEKEAAEIDLTPGGKEEKDKPEEEKKKAFGLDVVAFTESSNEIANVAGEFQNTLVGGFEEAFNKISDDSASTFEKIAAAVNASLELVTAGLDIVSETLDQYYEDRLTALDMKHESEITKIDERLARELELLENDGLTKKQKLQQEIAALKAAGDKKGALEKEKELKAIKLKEDANKRKEKADKDLAKKQYKIQVEQFNANKALQAVNATISFAQGLVSMWSSVWSIGNPIAAAVLGGVFTGLLTGVFAAQLALILSQQPPPPPRLEQGGTLAMGGRAIVGERGAEAVDLPAGATVRPLKNLNSPPMVNVRVFIGDEEVRNVVSKANIANQTAQANR